MTARNNHQSAPAVFSKDLSGPADALERLLRGLLEGHQRLLDCIGRKRESIRAADIESVTRICGEEGAIITRLGGLEKHREQLMATLTQTLRGNAAKSMTVSEFATHVAEPQQTRILAIAAQLREVLGDVKRQSSVIRTAAETLSKHMTGIVQTVHSALNRARVYGQRGTIANPSALPSIVDIKS